MNTQTLKSCFALSPDEIIAAAKKNRHYWARVRKEEFHDAKKWALTTVNLENSTIPPEAREEAELLLQSGLYVKEWIVATEVERQIEIPWKTIGAAIGALALFLQALVLVPLAVAGLALTAVLTADPILIAVVSDGFDKEEIWISIHRWVH